MVEKPWSSAPFVVSGENYTIGVCEIRVILRITGNGY